MHLQESQVHFKYKFAWFFFFPFVSYSVACLLSFFTDRQIPWQDGDSDYF